MAVMNASHFDDLSNTSPFTPSELFLVDPGEFDDLDLLDEFHQFTNVDFSEMLTADPDDSIARDRLNLGDVGVSPTEQSTASTTTDSEQPADSSTKLRRRAQNRASQRAFRERKEKHLKSLKSTLDNLGEKHQRLLDSYSQQAEIVTKLKRRIADLHAQIAAMSTYSEQDLATEMFRVQRPLTTEFQQFDAFSFSPLSVSAAGRHSQILGRAEVDRLPTLESHDLPEFEDLLNVP
ncbi:hypothetical protein AYO22_10751 [Fonsecaea multimorphosa]|nr:hypothetical protein AYO22_10751 [Fonsecaea multimorphosa]